MSITGILRWIRAAIFSSGVLSFFLATTSYTRVFPASGGLKSSVTLPAPRVLMVASFLSYSMRCPNWGVMPLSLRRLRGMVFSFSGSRGPKALSGGISMVCDLFSFSVGRASSTVLRSQPSPTTMSLGS